MEKEVITQEITKAKLPLHSSTTNTLLKVAKHTTYIHDIFGDDSCITTYTLDGNANDLSGNYDGTWSSTEQYTTGKFGQGALITANDSTRILLPDTLEIVM